MKIPITDLDILVRLLCAGLAGALIGINREEHGRPAGLRTTLLVCLAAAGAMLLANLLADTTGKPPTSYVSMDVMRLPLGVLTGVGFIGAGAILHRKNLVLGVTTAATLWFSTVIGFCFGSGEFLLGCCLLAAAVVILWGLRWVETHWWHRVEAVVTVSVAGTGPAEEQIRRILEEAGFRVTPLRLQVGPTKRTYRYNVHRHVLDEGPGESGTLMQLAEAGATVIWDRHP